MSVRATAAVVVLAGAAAAAGLGHGQDELLALGPDGTLSGDLAAALTREAAVVTAPAEAGGGIVFNVLEDAYRASEQLLLPADAFSVEAWMTVETPQRWGAVVAAIQDNGGYEKGWVLGYDEISPTFSISTEATDDGDGRLVHLTAGDAPYRFGAWTHVAATYDGETAVLYVDGAEAARSGEVGGRVLLADSARLAIGAYKDDDESYPHDGRILSASLAGRAWTAAEVAQRMARTAPAQAATSWSDEDLGWRVPPYLTWPAPDAVSVLAETTVPTAGRLRIRAEDESEWREVEPVRTGLAGRLHEFRPGDLAADTKHFYQVICTAEAPRPDQLDLAGEVLSFRTAPHPDDKRGSLTFTVIGDTQTNGEVAARVAALAHEHRPDFVVHCGDLVDTGSTKSDWTKTFFPAMRPLLEHAPLVPVLGNHEQDARLYYEYMSLPEPERWYSLRYGHAEFFMIDGNRDLGDQSAQLRWLAEALDRSDAKWRFAVLHQPPYTSDSNDYGETAEGPSTRGDMNVRNIVKLLERAGVDICFSGHVHDYERTFPIERGEVSTYEDGGVIYITAAGGGGHLEDFDKTNTRFGHKKARRHHFVHVGIVGDQLELHAIDEDGRLFDVLTLRKR